MVRFTLQNSGEPEVQVNLSQKAAEKRMGAELFRISDLRITKKNSANM